MPTGLFQHIFRFLWYSLTNDGVIVYNVCNKTLLEVIIMFCQNCGNQIDDNAVMCAHCGAPTPNAANAQQPVYQQPAQQYQQQGQYQQPAQPYQQQGQYQQPYYQQPYQQPVNDEPANGGFIALSILIPIVGIIFGCVSMSDGKKRAGKAYLIAALAAIGAYLLIGIIIGIAVAASNPFYYYYY